MTRFNKIEGDRATYEIGGDAPATARRRSVAVDIETMGLGSEQWAVKAVVIATADHAHICDPIRHRAAIIDALEAADEIVMHNSPFDAPPLVAAGLMKPGHVAKVFDTVVAARMTYPGLGGRDLGSTCERHLGPGYVVAKRSLSEAYRALTGRSKSQMFRELGFESDAYVNYAGFDGVMAARLRTVLPAAFDEWTRDHPYPEREIDVQRLFEREQVVSRVLLARTVAGIEIDPDAMERIRGEMTRTATAQDRLLAGYGVDIDLSRAKIKDDVVRVLDDLGAIPPGHRRLKNGAPSAAAPALERIDHPLVDALRLRSQALRFVEDYGEKLNELSHAGRIHPEVKVMQAVTGRMSMSRPPLQQYPPGVREMMKFDRPVTSLDWSSIEPVFAGNVFGQTEWIAGFEAGGDLYAPVAEAAGTDRTTAKTILLAQLYGQGATGLAGRLGITVEEAKTLIGRVMGNLDRVAAASKGIQRVSERFGKVQTVSGRIIPQPPDPTTGNHRFKGYIGVNHFVQGSCLDLLSEAIYTAHQRGLGDAIHIALHDELVVDTEAAHDFENIMLTPPDDFVEMAGRTPTLRVGRADLGHTWKDKSE